MAEPTEEQIVERAYQLWEQAGKPDGRADEFYKQAEQELLSEAISSPPLTPYDM
jgi:hypothetical protein